MSEPFAVSHGFGNFREIGRPTRVRGYDDATASRPAWLVPRWVRFRNSWPQPDSDGAEVGGIHDVQFRLDVAVVEGATIELPIFGLSDSHAFFQLTSLGDEYLFLMRVADDGVPPLPDRIRRIS